MSKLKHTPGPWEWVVNKTYKQVTLVGHRDGSREGVKMTDFKTHIIIFTVGYIIGAAITALCLWWAI